MDKLTILICLGMMMAVIPSCATKTVVPESPVIDRIIDAGSGEDIEFDTLVENIQGFDVIYLSEKHDNPDHHQFQQRVIQALVDSGKAPVIGFEFFSMDDTPDMMNFVDSGKVKVHGHGLQKVIEADLRRKLGWENQSDEMWKYYFDLMDLAKKHGLMIAGIDHKGSLKKRITRKGVEKLTGVEKEMIVSTGLSNTIYEKYMHEIFKEVHCGMANEKMQTRLYGTWVARNDKMAHSITRLASHNKGPVVVIVGGGHTEYNLGVIDRVNAINKDIKQVNIAFKEVDFHKLELASYLVPLDLKGFDPVPVADYIWFSRPVSSEDPCIKFESVLKRMKEKKDKAD